MSWSRPLFWSVVVLAALGCTGPMRVVSSGQERTRPEPGRALVVFMRPSAFSSEFSAAVYEAAQETSTFVGILPARRRIAYSAKPGRTRFMAVGRIATFLDAELAADRTYYVLVTPEVEGWRSRFALKPVTAFEQGTAKFREWFEACAPVENTDRSRAWAARTAADVERKKAVYFAEWQARQERPTLRAADGR